MSDFIKFAFSSGVVARALYGRSDLEKFDFGLKVGTNFFIDYRGGASTRPGFEFLDYLENDDDEIRIVRFKFNSEVANTYLLIFGRDYIRFAQDGAYVLEAATSVSNVSNANPAEVTANGHGFSDGDWVKLTDVGGMLELNSYTFVVANATTNTYELALPDGTTFDATALDAYTGGGTTQRIYTIANPYAPDDFRSLSFEQEQNEVVITWTGYKQRRLTWLAATNWTLEVIEFKGAAVPPTGSVLNPSASGTAGILVGVTSVSIDGVESTLGEYRITETSINYTTEEGSLEITWNAVPNTDYYNVYRSLVIPEGAQLTYGADLGFIGISHTLSYVDTNIIPDFTLSPPNSFDPFAQGAILHLNVDTPGTGYNKTDTTVAIADGTDFIGAAVVNDAGEVLSITVLDPGQGFTDASVVTIGGAGSGATASAITTALSGTYPRTSIKHQQRRVYAGTPNSPMTLFGSRVSDTDNFDRGQYLTAAGPYFLSVDADEQTPIKYMTANPNGIFLFTEDAVWQARGTDDQVLTATSNRVDPVTETGIADVAPLKIDREVIYVQTQGAAVRSLRPTNLPTYYTDVDLSIFSSQYFTADNPVQSWSYAKDPFRLVWAQRKDGSFLSFTYIPEHNVYAWSDHATQGYLRDVETVRENDTDQVYAVVQRRVGGRDVKYFERLAPRLNILVDEMWAVDSGLATTLPEPDATLTLSATTGTGITLAASAAVFTSADVGSHVRAGLGRVLITGFTSATELTGDVEITILDTYPETDAPRPYLSGEWSIAPVVESVSGLHHLEGLQVEILGDGNEFPEAIVTNGSVSVVGGASRIVVGLGFGATLVTLPLAASDTVIEGRPQAVSSVSVRLTESRGLWAGEESSGKLYEQKERINENYGLPISYLEGVYDISVRSGWDSDGAVRLAKRGPFNLTVLGLVVREEVGES